MREQLDKENSRCKESGEKENERPKRRSWNQGLPSWQNGEETDKMGWYTWSEWKTRDYQKDLRQRNKKVAENEKDHS